ncbi:MAG TPA: hypothetical protein VGR66_05380 [Candidatus Eisenbacteria bacterium]|nr:hypothetical protein [Candidatus Eisenbacteria bacterium]
MARSHVFVGGGMALAGVMLVCAGAFAQSAPLAPPSLHLPPKSLPTAEVLAPTDPKASAAPAPTVLLGTEFSYQGQLLKSGTAYTGSANFLFRLYDADTGGNQVGSDVTVNGVTVTSGIFTAQLDFGSVFDGNKRWLAISVQTTGDAGFTLLTPRRPLSATPYALRALNGPSGSSQWTTDANGIDYLGSVGIGVNAYPAYKLWVNSGTANQNTMYLSSQNATYAAFFTRNYASGGYGWVDDNSARHWTSGHFGFGDQSAGDYPVDVLANYGPAARITSYGSTIAYPGEGVRAALFVHGLTGGGVLGRTSGGIYASSTDSRAVSGWTTTGWGIDGNCTSSGTYGVLGTPNEGVFGFTPNTTLPAGKFNAPTGGVAIEANGLVKVKTLQILGGADLAEPFDVASGGAAPEPGSVVVIDDVNPGDLRVSDRPYDTRVAGVISGANGLEPGMVMKSEGAEHASGDHPVALTGRVWCKVDASFGAIRPGDLLTTSPVQGHAMKATDPSRRSGAIIGKAMTALEGGRGLVLALVSLQ